MRTRPLRTIAAACGAAVLALVATAPTHAADTPRSLEWPLDYFHANQVWQHGTGAGITVAVVDSGVNAKHHDLAGQVLPGVRIGDPAGDGTTDTQGHGTGMASLIAGTGRAYNGQGIKGLAYQAHILPVAITDTDQVTEQNIGLGIRYSVDHGARVINVSSGTSNTSSGLQDALTYASQHDVVVVASAGNDGDTGNQVDYPAAIPGVVAVAGVDQTGRSWSGSAYGAQVVIAAPATNQERADYTGYASGEGTSDAAAWVSGAAAILRGMHPDWTAGQTIRQLIATAHKPDGVTGRDPHYGYGIVDPLAAVTTPLAAGPTTNPLLAGNPQSAPDNQNPPTVVVKSQNVLVYVAIGVLVLLLVGGGILVAVLAAKRRHPNPANPAGPAGPFPGGGWPPPPQPGPVHGQPPYSQPPHGQPPHRPTWPPGS